MRDCTCLGTCRGAEGLSERYRCALEPRQAVPAWQGTPKQPQAVVAHEALSPPPSGGAPDLRELLIEAREFINAHCEWEDMPIPPNHLQARIDAALSSSVSPKGE
jgi:hypothetical protein